MLPSFRLAAAILPVLCLSSLLNAGAQAPTAPPMIVQVPYIGVGAGNIVSGTSSTSKAAACAGYANVAVNNYGDGCPASQVGVSAPWGVTADPWGNVYIADTGHLEVRVIYGGATTVGGVANPATAMITAANTALSIATPLVAGDVYALAGGLTAAGTSGFGCNGGGTSVGTNGNSCPATDSYLKGPYNPAVDSAGNVFIPDKSNSLIYVVLANATGLAAQLVAKENAATFSTCSTSNSVLSCTGAAPQVGHIYLIAGSGSGFVDNALASGAKVNGPYSVAVDSSENVYIADYNNDAVRMINGPNNSTSGGVAAGYIHTIAGAGSCGTASCTGTVTALTGTPASNSAALGAKFLNPSSVLVDGSGNIYIGDNGSGSSSVPATVRVIYAGGTNNPLANLINLETGVSSPTANNVYTIAGNGVAGSSAKGAGLLATASGVALDRIVGLGLDGRGNLYIMDYGSHSELAEVNANTGYLYFLSADGLTTSATKFSAAGVYCSSGTGAGSGPVTLDVYGDGCPAPQSFTSNAEGNIGIDPSGNLYYADNGDGLIRKLSFNNSFAATAVGNTAATQNLAFVLLTGSTGSTVTSGTTAVSVSTQGITANSDFTNAGAGDSCSGTTTMAAFTGSSTNTPLDVCIVPVVFKPAKAGMRSGAVQITGTIGGTSTLLGTAYLNGIGNGAALTVDPGASSTLGSGTYPKGVAADSAGNVYVAYYSDGTVYRISGGTSVEIGNNLSFPGQIALDGAGNLYVAESGDVISGDVIEFAGASTSTGIITGKVVVSGLNNPWSVAVDASGNLYIADTNNNRVLMQPVGNGAQTVLGSGFNLPYSVAVDASGNVYVADAGHDRIVKLTMLNGVVTQQSTVVQLTGDYPLSVAADAAGDIYYSTNNSAQVLEIPVSGTTTVLASGFIQPNVIALDPSGNLYVADLGSTSGISFYNRTAATLPAIPDQRSGDATLTNVGNASYAGGISGNSDLTAATDFTFAAGSSNGCSTPTSLTLAAGTNCDLSVTANTSSAIDTVTFTGGSTLAVSSAASVAIATFTTLNIPTTSITYGTAITGTATVTPASGSLHPTGTVTLMNGSTSLGSCTLANSTGNASSCSFSLSNVNAGSPSITASYGGDSNDSGSTSIGTIVLINQDITTTSLSFDYNITSIVEGSSFSGQVYVHNGFGSVNPPGSVAFYLDGSSTAATSCVLDNTECNWTLSGVAIGGHTLTATYIAGNTNFLSSSTSTSITVTAPPQAPAVATGDSRTVTEPSFPAVCQQLTAALTSVNDDLPTSVDATNSNPDAARIQAALNSCSASYSGSGPGQAVELSVDGAGHNAYLTGPLSMPSNVTLLVDPGVYVYFSRNAQDYDKVSGTHTCGTVNNNSATATCLPLIDIPGTSTNVGIMGYGKLDGRGGDTLLNAISPYQGQSWWGLATIANSGGSQQNPRFIQMDTGSSNITMYKITLRNAPKFHVSTTGAVSGFTAWDIKIVTPTSSRNTDGIDPGNATNFTITRSWISDGDDNVAVGGSGTTSPSSNISVTNNRFFAGHGESIGSYTSAGVSNVLFDGNMLSGNGTASLGSSINNTADSNSTGLRIKSGYDRGGVVSNIQYSNSCFQNHKAEIIFSPNYENTIGIVSPNFENILLQNLNFLTAGTVQLTGTSNSGTVYPLGVTLDNVSYPSPTFTPAPTNATLIYGPGLVSANFISGYAGFVGSNGNTATNNITVSTLFPPTCNFTYIAPELTGPAGVPQTIIQGQNATAVVILTPAVGGAPYPTGTVTLTDALTSTSTTVTLPGGTDTISIPLGVLSVGTHTFTATYSGDTNYPLTNGQTVYSTTAPYVITVNGGSLGATATSLSGVPASAAYGAPFTAVATVTGSNPTGTVQFIVGGGGSVGSYVYATAALVSGSASASISLPYNLTAYTVTAVYSGDSVNQSSASSTNSVTIGQAFTVTALASNITTTSLGHPVSFTATVTSTVGIPTGTVNFTYSVTSGGTQIPLSSATLSAGSASASVDLPLGTDYVTATFVESGSFAGSASAPQPITVNVPTIIGLPSSPIALPYTMTTIAGGSGLAIPSSGNMACAGATDKYGDGCLATAIGFTASDDMRAVVADPFGNVYLSDISATLVRRITPNGIISNFAGRVTGTACVPTATAGCTPTLVSIGKARGVGTDAAGNIYIANYTGNQVFEVKQSTGLLYLVAGTGTGGATGDGNAATSAQINQPRGAWGDSVGNVYIADTANNKIRVVDVTGNIHTFAGTGTASSTGDGGLATSATINNPQGVIADANLNVYIADSNSGKIRVVCVTCGTNSPLDALLAKLGVSSPANGFIYTVAGNGTSGAFSYTAPVLSTTVSMSPQKLAFDNTGNLYISDGNGVIWFLDFHSGYLRAIAANAATVCSGASSTYGYAAYGDGCPATQAKFGTGTGGGLGVGADALGNIYISDSTNGLIRKVVTGLAFPSTAVNATTTQPALIHFFTTPLNDSLAGGDWSLALPSSVPNSDGTYDWSINSSFTPKVPGLRSSALTFTDNGGNTANLALTGTGLGAGSTIDPATQISFGTGLSVAGLAIDNRGNVYVSNATSKKLLRFAPSALTQGASALSTTLATLTAPGPIAIDPRGYVYVADTSTGTITQITPAGTVSTLPFTFTKPAGLAVDALNNLYVSDSSAQAVYQINPIAGVERNLNLGTLVAPAGLAIDPAGNLLVADPGVPALYRFNPIGTRATVSTSATAPSAVLTDAAGNLLIGDSASILAVPASANSASFTVASIAPSALAIDAAGNLYTGSGDSVLKLTRTQGYVQYPAGSAAKTVSMLESGNLALTSTSLSRTDTSDYGLTATASTDCTVSSGLPTALAIGGVCSLSASYTPTTFTTTTDTVTVSNVLNAALSTPASVQLTLTGPATAPRSTTVLQTTPSSPVYGQTITLKSITQPSDWSITAPVPAGSVTIYVDYYTQLTAAVDPATGIASISAPVLNAGHHQFYSVYASSNGYITSTSSTDDLDISQATPTITWSTPSAITYGTALSSTQLNASLSVAGTCVYTPAAGTVLTAGLQTLSVTCTPTDTTNYTTPTKTVKLQVNKANPAIAWATPAAITYGTALSATQLNASATGVTGAALPGTFTYTPLSGAVLTAGSQTLSVSFVPTDTANYTTPATATVQLQVNKANPAIAWATPSAITYGTALSGTQLNASATGVTGAALPGTFTYTPLSGTVLTAGSQTLSVSFVPTDTTDYTTPAAPATVQLQVNKANPAITWATPSAITYGTALSGTQLNAGATGVTGAALPGVFTYSPLSGAVLTAGSQTLSVSFVPTDTANYTTPATATVQLQVNKANPAIAWATPAAITYGAALSATQLNASATGVTGAALPGTFTYSPLSGAVLTAGSQALSVSFVPTDTANYTTPATATVQLQVNKANPAIAWATPAAITYGTALSATQLNASATGVTGAALPGVFTYSPLLGTVLTAGSQTLSVSFAPTDTANYTTPATATVQLQVNKASSAIAVVPSLNPILLQNPVTYTATVSSTVGKPTGTVTFQDGGVALATCTGVTVTTATGVASCAVTYTATGTHTINALYNGDANFLAAGPSNTVSETAIDINLAAPPSGGATGSSQTVLPGGTATYSFTFAPSSGTSFPVAVTLTVTGLPTGATASLTPTSWSLTSSNPWTWTLPANTSLSGNTLLAIQVPQTTAAVHPGNGKGGDLTARLAPFALALLLLPFAARLRRTGKRLGRMMFVLAVFAAGVATIAGIGGCGSASGFFAQQQQSYTVTVTATAGALSHSSTVTLTVQ